VKNILTGTKDRLDCVKRFLDYFAGVDGAADVFEADELEKAVMSTARQTELNNAITALELIRSLGDATIASTNQSVQELQNVANDIAAISFSESLLKIQQFKDQWANSSTPGANV
jgi:isochorismate synthase EntC